MLFGSKRPLKVPVVHAGCLEQLALGSGATELMCLMAFP